MKKSDLTRRAENDVKRVYKDSASYDPDAQEAHAYGFESGYRAARADLRVVLKRVIGSEHSESATARAAFKWLRPIR